MALEWSKIKNIIILMLLGVNIFLLVLVSFREWRSAQYDESAREQVVSILARNGIQVDHGVLPADAPLAPMTVTRDPESESRQAQALLGTLETGSRGSTYQGEKGSARFYLDGEFTAQFRPGAWPIQDRSPQDAALELLTAMGLEAQVDSAGDRWVTLCQTWQGAPVFNCLITVEIQEGELRAVASGSRRFAGSLQTEPGEAMTVVTALMQFLDYIKNTADLCSAITDMTAGYMLDGQSDPARLTPAWRLTTDAGTYSINAITGEVRSEG